ncbi:MAG: hypothetical protein ABI693_08395 [Bryobacteraceae bacterium]
MRYFLTWLAVCLVAGCALAQMPDGSPGTDQIKDIEKIRQLVEMGALPRNRLIEAENARDEARDQEILKHTLYGSLTVQELTEDQCEEMIAAAKRMYDRQVAKVQISQKLVEVGARPRTSSIADLEELEFRQKTVTLAEQRTALLKELAALAKSEEATINSTPSPLAVRYDGSGVFRESQLRRIEFSYMKHFGRDLPISANGMTAIHRSLGYDHRDRVDVALSPDTTEGRWLLGYLESQKIPYFAFRAAIARKATAPHIHIGPPSLRLHVAD